MRIKIEFHFRWKENIKMTTEKEEYTLVIVSDAERYYGPDAYVLNEKDLTDNERKMLDFWVEQNKKGIHMIDYCRKTPYEELEGEDKIYILSTELITGWDRQKNDRQENPKSRLVEDMTPYLSKLKRLIRFYMIW